MQVPARICFFISLAVIVAMPVHAFANMNGANLDFLTYWFYGLVAGVIVNLGLSIGNIFWKNIVVRIFNILLLLPYAGLMCLAAIEAPPWAIIPGAVVLVECILIYYGFGKKKSRKVELQKPEEIL